MIKNENSINEFLNQVNNKVRLSDIIGQFVNLTEKGNSFVGKCPFHNENTPSFNVSNNKSLFHCFGCKAGGNILNFISKYKKKHLKLFIRLHRYEMYKNKFMKSVPNMPNWFAESIIDDPRVTYAPGVFDDYETKTPRIKPSVREIVDNQLKEFGKDFLINQIRNFSIISMKT